MQRKARMFQPSAWTTACLTVCSVRQGRDYRRPTVWGSLRLGNGGRDRLLLPMIRDQKERRDGDWEDPESPRHRVHGGGGSAGRSC